MFGSHTSTKTYPMLRHSRIINGSNPQTTASQFMSQPIHALPITNDNRHLVCRLLLEKKKIERLLQVVLGAQLDAPDDAAALPARGDHHGRYLPHPLVGLHPGN